MTQEAVVFEITLKRPALITKPGAGEENSSESYSYIPGSVLRGLFIHKFLNETGFESKDLAQNPTTRKLFFDGGCKFLNAYVMDDKQHRMLPKPLSWRVEKDLLSAKDIEINDFGVAPVPEMNMPKLPKGDFVWTENGNYFVKKQNQFDRVHNASENRMLKKAGTSFVFRYQSIPAGTKLKGVIIGKDIEELVQSLNWTEKFSAHVGGSRSAGYGKCDISLPEKILSAPLWEEYQELTNPSEPLMITLLSDMILLDDQGQYTTDLDHFIGGKHNKDLSFVKTTIVGGFNAKWGLPIPQAMAIQAGSVFVYKQSEIDPGLIRKMVETGIGLRTIDGFGRIAVNWQGVPKLKSGKMFASFDSSVPKPKKIQLSDMSAGIAQTMMDRMVRDRLESRLSQVVSDLELVNKVSNSQLSRLRKVCQNVLSTKDLSLLGKHIDLLKASSDQIENCRVKFTMNGQAQTYRLPYFLKIICNDQEGLEKLFGKEEAKQYQQEVGAAWHDLIWQEMYIPVIGDLTYSEDQIKERYHVEFIARMLQALFKKKTRLNQVKEGSE